MSDDKEGDFVVYLGDRYYPADIHTMRVRVAVQEIRITELEAENAKLRGLCAAADWQGIRWRNGQDAEHREWDKTWEALAGGEGE